MPKFFIICICFICQDKAEKLVRQLACPTKIRFWIEQYDKDFLNDPGKYERKSQAIEKKMKDAEVGAVKNIERAVKRLNATLRSKKSMKGFEEAWEMLKKNVPTTELVLEINKKIDAVPLTRLIRGLGHALLELCDVNDVFQAQKIWEAQCYAPTERIWNVLPGEFTSTDTFAIQDLAYMHILSPFTHQHSKEFETEHDQEFARDYILSERYMGKEFIIRAENLYYRKCRRVVYFSHDPEIGSLRQSF